MIKITVELWPFGQEDKKEKLADAEIWNDASGTPWLGSYGFKLYDKAGRIFQSGGLGEFKRQEFSVWWLVAAVMKIALASPEKSFRDGQIRGLNNSKAPK